MAIIFNQAPIVTSGSVPLASQMAGMAEAFNSRLRSGLGDCTKRIHQYVNNLTRQIRNPDADRTATPSLGEFPMFYQHLDTDQVNTSWPLVEAGEPEGANVASPAAQFVFGIGTEEEGTPGEGDNFTTYNFYRPTSGSSPEDYWTLAKYQRGGYDPNTGAQNAPMWYLAQRHFRLVFPDWSRHHKSPGGYLPTPEKSQFDCRKENISGESVSFTYWTSYIYKFRRLSDQQIVYTGTGTCGPDAGGSASDIYGIADYPFAWYVYHWDGTYLRFDKSEYIMVNDGGGTPSREDGGQIQRLMVNPFIADFRGTEFQRFQKCFETPYIDYSFANQDFYTTQYQLAPNYGTENGDVIDVTYPSYTITSTITSGSSVNILPSVPDGFRVGGHLLKHRHLASNVAVQMLRDDTVIHTFTIYANSGSAVETFDNGPTTGSISYRFTSSVSFTDPSGYLYFEQSLPLDYKPEIWDGYALIRLSSTKGAIGDEMDTRGIDFEYSRTIYDNYRKYGCFLNVNGATSTEQQTSAINVNPVFDAFRKYVNSFTRTINGTDLQLPSRPMIVGYEVSESYQGSTTSSKSILYFNRYQSGLGLQSNNLDCFVGLINAENSQSNGIVSTAPIQGYTNEWLLELCGKPYHPSENSIWKPSVYANYFPQINRCHLRPSDFECGPVYGTDAFRFHQENNELTATDLRNALYFPESLTAYNYDTGKNARNQLNRRMYDEGDTANMEIAEWFYKSCQVYPKPYVIESVVEQPGSIVKVTLSSRLQHCEEAPNIIGNNVAGWVFNTVAAEPYRTDENIVRLFLLKMFNDNNNPSAKTGDNSVNSSLPFESDNPYASIYPTFFFTKLVSKPYANDGIENTGSLDYSGSYPRAYDLQYCETILRAVCEGFVDETLSTTTACNTDFATDYDYTYSNLCNDAFGRAWVSNITASLRPDYPLTYGPLPDMIMNSQVWNQIGSAVNLLTKVRLPLPYRIQARFKTYTGDKEMSPDWPGGVGGCSEDGISRAIDFNFTPAEASTLTETTEWRDVDDGLEVGTTVQMYCGPDGSWFTRTVRTTAEVGFQTQDPLAWYALNDDLRALASGSVSSAAIFVREEQINKVVDMELTETPNGCSDDENFWSDGVLWWNDVGERTVESNCSYRIGGTEMDAGQVVTTDIAAAYKYNAIQGSSKCHYVPYTTNTITVVNQRHMIIQVPTV